MNEHILSSLCFVILFANISHAQPIINPNIKHDWENIRYIINANSTVLDTNTGLIWKRCPEGLSGLDCTIGSPESHNWKSALNLANSSIFAGLSDWRLPNIKEFRTIAAFDRYAPAININIFPNTARASYWSSSPDYVDPSNAYIFTFENGRIGRASRNSTFMRVRLVRGGSSF